MHIKTCTMGCIQQIAFGCCSMRHCCSRQCSCDVMPGASMQVGCGSLSVCPMLYYSPAQSYISARLKLYVMHVHICPSANH